MSEIVAAKLYIGSGLGLAHRSGRPFVFDPRQFAADVEEVVSGYFDGATISKARGRWQGKGEPSLVVEVWGNLADRADFLAKVNACAIDLSATLHQHQVAVVLHDPRNLDEPHSVTYFEAGHERATIPSRRHHRGTA